MIRLGQTGNLFLGISLLSLAQGMEPENSGLGDRGFRRVVTRPDIDAPMWYMQQYINTSVLAPGYWLVAFYHGLDQKEPGDAWV